MNYILKHFDTPLVRFHASEDTNDPEITILWINEANQGLLPMDMGELTEEHISKWLQRRTIPKNRAFVRTFLAYIAFTGYGSSIGSSLMSSPEFTTNGMLPKCWRRISGKIVLYKGGTSGASNAGNEPYSEYYASQIAQAMGINAISYGLSKWKGILCSTCELFTSMETAYIPVGRVVTKGGMKAVQEYYRSLGPDFEG